MCHAQRMNYPPAANPRWYAIFTKYKCEKSVKARLISKGIETYLPLRKYERKYGAVRRTVELPMMSCYLFVKIVKAEYIPVLQTENVVKFIKFADQLIPIPDKEIELLQKIVNNYTHEVFAEPYQYEKGDKVEITQGSLNGLIGKLISKEGKDKFIVEMKSFSYSLQIQIPKDYLKPIKPKIKHL